MVPVDPDRQTDLAQWREKMEALLRCPNAYSSLSVLGNVLSAYLAIMPPDGQPDRDCDEQGCLLQGIAHAHEKGEPFCAECAQSISGQPDVNAELLKVAFLNPLLICAECDFSRRLHRDDTPEHECPEETRAAIAQATKGA
jgi:hypothetical protein